MSGDKLTSKSGRMGAMFGSPEMRELDDVLLYTIGVDVCVGTIGRNVAAATMEEAGLHSDAPLISCVI